MNDSMIDGLQYYIDKGREHGATSYNVSGEYLVELMNRLKTQDATINKLQELLGRVRIRDLK
jgi:hypothetical protein